MQLESSVTLFDDEKVESKFAELRVTADGITSEVSKKVGANEIISRINQSAESVYISASKVDIDGVITAINGGSTTTIDGGKITTNSIGADKIKVSEIQIGAAQISSGTIDTARIGQLSIGKVNGLQDQLDGKAALGAENTADYYVTDIGSTGIFISPAGQSPSASAPGNSVKIDGTGMNVYKGGTSVAFYGDEAQVGKSGSGHVSIQSTGVDLYGGDGTVNLAHFGYAKGNAQSGEATAPYYTFGVRMNNTPIGNYSFVEGAGGNIAQAYASHAEGHNTEAKEQAAHAEGWACHADGLYSHAEGFRTLASGEASHTSGIRTVANGAAQTVIGRDNIADATSIFIIGNGANDNESNALTVDWNGNLNIASALRAGGYKIITAATFTKALTIAAGNVVEGTVSVAKTGYTPIGVIGTWSTGTGSSFAMPYRSYLDGTNYTYGVRNLGTSQITPTLNFRILYISATQGI